MSNQLFVFTAGSDKAYQHYIKTIIEGFTLDSIKQFIDDELYQKINKHYLDKKIRAWGATPGSGNKNTWGKMSVGDKVLIYRNRTYEYFASVTFKFQNNELAKNLWGIDSKGQTWEYIYFLDGLTKISIPIEPFNNIFDFKKNYHPMGFGNISQNKIVPPIEKYGSIDNLLKYIKEKKYENSNIINGKNIDNSIYNHLIKFLKQAESSDLGTRSYPNNFKNYEMKVSFGKGVPARIPWIAFLGKDQKVSKGINPVYLYYKKIKKLILAYGVSETNTPEISWENIENPTKVNEYFQKQFNERPDRYGTSYVFKAYDVENISNLKKEEIDEDLNEILVKYRNCLKINSGKKVKDMKTVEKIEHLHKFILSKGFNYSLKDVANFYLSIKTKPFVILAGISGTGKTQLARKFADAINAKCELIPVKPDWTDNSDLIGYVNIDNKFKKKKIIKLIEKAIINPNKIYIVLLDEMNLARVEHYFSDFLSIIETREYDGNRIITNNLITDENFTGEEDLKKLSIPDNVYVVGTVNMDETTHPFSRKVLDRANSIELNEVNLDWENKSSENMKELKDINNDFLKAKYIHYKDLTENEKEYCKKIINDLKEIDKILKEADFQIGYRIRDELCFYMLYQREIKDIISYDEAFDFQIIQKILPRIQGSSSRVKKSIVKLIEYLSGKGDFDENYSVEEIEKLVKEVTKNRKSINKLLFMLRRYEDDGFTSFWI